MNKQDFLSDISLQTGINAYRWTSFSPERRGASVQNDYAETLESDFNLLSKWATTDEKKAVLLEEFARYRAGYRKKTLDHLSAQSRCFSSMITGPANFNVRRAERSNRVEHRRLEEVIEYRERALKAIEKALRPELRPIMSGDSDAVLRLKEKIALAEKNHTQMIEANKAIKKLKKDGPESVVSVLIKLGFSELNARKLLIPDFCGLLGFRSFSLANNNANIRRMEARLRSIEKNQAAPIVESSGSEASFCDCPAENRVRLTFPGKPSDEIRAQLKSNGFRWTPSLRVWQAYRNPRTIPLARKIAGINEVVRA